MKHQLPLLDSIRIASPCSADWDRMVGDEKVRFCGSCAKNVYNLSAMTSADAERLLGGADAPCVRFYQRADGTVLTTDCPVGVRRKRRKKVALAVAGAGALAWAAVTEIERRTVLGGMQPPPIAMTDEELALPVTAPTVVPPVAMPLPPVEEGSVKMGGMPPYEPIDESQLRPTMGQPPIANPGPKR